MRGMSRLWLVVFIAVAVLQVQAAYAQTFQFAGGDGTEADPYQVANKQQFEQILHYNFQEELSDKHFIQTADIDWQGGKLYSYAVESVPFTGVYDGNGYKLKNFGEIYLNFNTQEQKTEYWGIFKKVGLNGVIKNLGIEVPNLVFSEVNVNYPNDWSAVLVAVNAGTIENCFIVDSTITNEGQSAIQTSGLVGLNWGLVTGCRVENTTFAGKYWRAALIGDNAPGCPYGNFGGGLFDSHVDNVTLWGAEGGLVGENEAQSSFLVNNSAIYNCYANNFTIKEGLGSNGGIVGYNKGSVAYCWAKGVIESEGGDIGGIAGYMDSNGGSASISHCYADIRIDILDEDGAKHGLGGIVGSNADSKIQNCYAVGTLNMAIPEAAMAGGIVGIDARGDISNSYAAFEINRYNDGVISGGVVGFWDTSINPSVRGTYTNCYYDNEVYNVTYNSTMEGTGLATAQMQGAPASSNMTGFDYTTIWRTTSSYPELRWNPPTLTMSVGNLHYTTTLDAPEVFSFDLTGANLDLSSEIVVGFDPYTGGVENYWLSLDGTNYERHLYEVQGVPELILPVSNGTIDQKIYIKSDFPETAQTFRAKLYFDYRNPEIFFGRILCIDGDIVVGISGNACGPGVTLTYTDGEEKTVTTAADGNYEIRVPVDWSGTVTPSKPGTTFNPPSISYTDVAENQKDQDYACVTDKVIKGNAGKPGGFVSYQSFGPGDSGNVTTDECGNYTITVADGWSGVLTPFLEGHLFEPENRLFNVVSSDYSQQDFTIVEGIRISGKTDQPSQRVYYTTEDGSNSVYSDNAGDYSFLVKPGWSGTVAAYSSTAEFSPHSHDFADVTADRTGVDFATAGSSMPTISGAVPTAPGRVPVYLDFYGVPVEVWASADAYSAAVPSGWSGTVRPRQVGKLFDPEQRTFDNVTSDLTGQDFTASDGVAIQGDTHLPGTVLSYDDGGPKTVVSKEYGGKTGYYDFTVPSGWSGTVTPSKTGYFMNPPNRTFASLAAHQRDQDFEPSEIPGANPATTYPVAFEIDDGANPIEGAGIDIDGSTVGTDAGGQATVQLADGSYAYTIYKNCFETIVCAVTVSGGGETVAQTMTSKTDPIDVVLALLYSGKPFKYATVQINGQSLKSDVYGHVHVTLAAGQTYPYTVSKLDFEGYSGTLTADCQSALAEVELGPVSSDYEVSFNVTECSAPLENVEVEINGNTLTTDTDGKASVSLPDGNYPWTASKTGYTAVSDSVAVSGAPVDVPVSLSKTENVFTFAVSDGTDPVPSASISIDGRTLKTDADGEATVSLAIGSYPYTITCAGYHDAEGNASVADCGENTTEVGLIPSTVELFELKFYVSDDLGNPVSGARVSIDGQTLTTDANGVASIRLPEGTYPFTIIRQGYEDATGSAAAGTSGNNTIEIAMGSDQSVPIPTLNLFGFASIALMLAFVGLIACKRKAT